MDARSSLRYIDITLDSVGNSVDLPAVLLRVVVGNRSCGNTC